MLEDLKIYEDIVLEYDETLVNWWRCEDLEIHVLIKLGVCVEPEFHMKIKKLEDW